MNTLLKSLDVRRIAMFSFPCALALMALALLLKRSLSADEAAASVAVPLIISYILVRAIIWLVSEMPEPAPEEAAKQREQFERDTRLAQSSGSFSIDIGFGLVLSFVCGMWVVVTAGLSLGIYAIMGLAWAMSIAFWILKGAFWLVAITAVALCIGRLCRIWLVKMARFFKTVFRFPTRRYRSA